jgi:putative chitinase
MKMEVLKKGSKGENVELLQKALLKSGFNPGPSDGIFGDATTAAVMAFQKSSGLLADGIAGPKTEMVLGLTDESDITDELSKFTPDKVSQMFPDTSVVNIKTNLPIVLNGLKLHSLTDKTMGLMALATIRAETESFRPINEMKSKWNTSPDGHPFDLYDNRKDLGNTGLPDGSLFKGRGFVQLTGRANYLKYGRQLGLADGLIADPERANNPEIAAQLLALFLKERERKIKEALLDKDYKTARKLVNGGTHGLKNFTGCYEIGNKIII